MNILLRIFSGLPIVLWSLLGSGCATATTPEPAAALPDQVFAIAEVAFPPVPRVRMAPEYPFEMRRRGISGEAVIEFVVDPAGNVRAPRVVSVTNPAFGAPALAAVAKWKFSPGRLNDRAVATRMQVPVVFALGPLVESGLPAPRLPPPVGEVVPLFNFVEVEVKPVPRFRGPPQYPLEMRRQGVSGSVIVEFIIDTAGGVQNAHAISATNEAFAEAAVAAVARWRFTPGRKEARVVATRIQVPVEFELNQR